MNKNFIKRHKRVIKEIEIRKFFRLIGLKWLVVILMTTITGYELYYLETIIVLIVIYDFYITITKRTIIFKKIVDIVLIIISILNIIYVKSRLKNIPIPSVYVRTICGESPTSSIYNIHVYTLYILYLSLKYIFAILYIKSPPKENIILCINNNKKYPFCIPIFKLSLYIFKKIYVMYRLFAYLE